MEQKILILMLVRYKLVKIEDYEIQHNEEENSKTEIIKLKCYFNPNDIDELFHKIEGPRKKEKEQFNKDLIF